MKVSIGLKKAATLCVLKHGNQFLLLKRLKVPNQGMYTPVGGKLEPYENPLQAAIRETFEETGIKVDTMKFCGLLTESAPTKYNWINYVYLAEIDFVEPPECNEGTLAWIPFEEVLNVPTPTSDWYIYKYILEGKPFCFNADYDADTNLLLMIEDIEGSLVYKMDA